MRIAYCMMVYKDPEQVLRLVERLYSPTDYFYIHRDKRTKSDEGWEDLRRKYPNANVVFAAKYDTFRNSFKLVEAALDGMNCCSSFDYDYFVILTANCYPIKPLSTIKEELGRKNVAYMEYFKLPYERWDRVGGSGGLNRINYYYIGTRDDKELVRIPRLSRALPYHLQPYGGGQCCLLPRRFVDYIQDYLSTHPKIISYYKYCFMSAEMFFQTIIMNSPLRGDVVNDHKWYIRWPPRSSHPETLRKDDFSELMRSDKFFARKFDANIDIEILNLIDREILRH